MARRRYTPELANRSLPLVRRIAADIQVVARRIQAAVHEVAASAYGGPAQMQADELAELRGRLASLIDELDQLGVELKDPLTGLLDFRADRGGVDVYLCWRLGEESVGHWHPLDSGFPGRRPIAEF